MFLKLLELLQLDSSEINPSPEVATARHARAGFYVAAAASLIVAIACFFSLLPFIPVSNWTRVEGALVKAEISSSEHAPALKVTYKYRAGGKTITATEIQPVDVVRDKMQVIEKANLSDSQVLQATKSDLEQGTKFSVYYNPYAPIESRLSKTAHGQLTPFAVFIGLCFCLFLGAVLKLIYPGVSAKSAAINDFHNKAQAEQSSAENNRKRNQEIIDALGEKNFSEKPQSSSEAPLAIPLDSSAADTIHDGATINIKQSEKDTL